MSSSTLTLLELLAKILMYANIAKSVEYESFPEHEANMEKEDSKIEKDF